MEKELIKQHEDKAYNGYYSHHLSEISNKGNQAYATSDIHNHSGVLIARKGIEINHDVRKQLVRHKLLKPLDNHVGLEREADTHTLIQEFRQLLDKHPDLRMLDDAMKFGPEFEKLLKIERLHPRITQKLTVLESQMRCEFEKSIFSAWMATMIAREMGLSMEERRDTLVAALIHDIGLLHLDPEIACSNKKLTAEEWNTVHAHVIVGKIIADSVPGLSPDISRAVIEHHEDCYGSGYPLAINADKLALPGRIIGMTDSIHSIRIKSFRNTKRTLGDIRPFLQLNPTTRGYEVYQATMSIIKKSGLKPIRHKPDGCPKKYAKNLGRQVSILGEAKQSLDNIHEGFLALGEEIENKKRLATITAITNRIRSTIHESGLLTHELASWLSQETHTSDIDDLILGELNEIELLIKELTWQIRNSVRMFHSCNKPDTIKNQGMLDHLETSINSIQGVFDRLSEVGM